MKKKVILIILFSLLNATTLKELLNSAKVNNDLLKAKKTQELSISKAIKSIDKSYNPTIDAGFNITNSNPKSFMRPGAIYTAFVKLNYIIYDGGIKKYKKIQKFYELSSIKSANKEFENSLYLQIIQDFYNIKTLEELIKALKYKQKSIIAQYKKIKAFKDAGIISDIELFKLEAALENLKFNLNSLKFQKKSLLMNLGLKTQKRIKKLSSSYLIKRKVLFTPNYKIKSLRDKITSIQNSARATLAENSFKLNLSITHNRFAYSRVDKTHPKGLKEQTNIYLNGVKRVWDGEANNLQAQSIKLYALSLKYELQNELKSQKNSYKLSKLRISNQKIKIKSAKSSLLASKKNYYATLKKFNAGIIDSSEYLDALSSYIEAKANYKKALNDLEVAYALYYFNAGKNIKRFIK